MIATRTPHVLTKRKAQRFHSKDGGGKQMKRRTRFSTVICAKHGSLNQTTRLCEVRVPMPFTKKEQFGLGCPFCLQEKEKGDA